MDNAETVYNEAIALVIDIYRRILEKKELDIQDLYRLMEKFVNEVNFYDDKMISLVSNTYLKDHLYYHTINVSVLVIKVGRDLGYSPSQLIDLSVLSLLHAIELSEDEGHKWQDLEEQELIQEIVKRKEIKPAQLKECLSLIAVVDVYESLTHARAYRQRFMPYEVLKAIISAGQEVFHPEIVKKIIEVFSFYPLGSFVRLNTEEIAQVIKINKDFPLRPQVIILVDGQGNKLEEKRTVDLSAHLIIYIKEPVLEPQ